MKGMLKNIKRKFMAKQDQQPPQKGASPPSKPQNQDSERKHPERPKKSKDSKSSNNAKDKTRSTSNSNRDEAAAAAGGPTKNGLRKQGPFDKKDLLEPMPSFRECIAAEKEPLLIRKLKLCCVMFDFNDESDSHGKEMKRQILLELVDYISTTKKWFSEPVLIAIIEMVSANLFRALPPSPNEIFDPEEDDPVLDPSWPHLQIVYEFLLRFVVSTDTDTKLLKKYINGPFVLKVLDVFDSEDPRERDYLKTILHRIYGKFMSLRSFIRKSINNVFYKFIYETGRHNGVGELLEILGSIINGFALPLKLEHKKFLRNILIPLHKVKILSVFHQQLAYCVTQFIDKDPKLAKVVIGGLLNFWPLVNSSKEVLFLNELEEVLELTQAEEFKQMMVPLFGQIARSISSPHFQVAERALFLWNNEYIAHMTTEHRETILPILYPALHRNSKNHWNATVHSLTFNIIKMFMEMDADLFDLVSKQHNEKEESEQEERKVRQSKWEQLEKLTGHLNQMNGVIVANGSGCGEIDDDEDERKEDYVGEGKDKAAIDAEG